jgi:hypothetical protein
MGWMYSLQTHLGLSSRIRSYGPFSFYKGPTYFRKRKPHSFEVIYENLKGRIAMIIADHNLPNRLSILLFCSIQDGEGGDVFLKKDTIIHQHFLEFKGKCPSPNHISKRPCSGLH